MHPLVKAASQLREAAQTHKRLSAQHRRQARALMRSHDELIAECQRRGIHVDIQPTDGADKESRP